MRRPYRQPWIVPLTWAFAWRLTRLTVDSESIAQAGAHTRACAPARPGPQSDFTVNPVNRQPPVSTPRISGGRAVVDGVEHVMRVAKPSSVTARLYGMNPNHHVRVWCTCMDHRRRQRTPAAVRLGLDDPRALGDVDWLGIADVRQSGSALNLFREHIREVASSGRP